MSRAEAALSAPADAPLVIDGTEMLTRHVLVTPGSTFRGPSPP